jgi:hypothetical protein
MPPVSGSLEGPWVDALWFDVPVTFVSKANYRFKGRGDSTWTRIKDFEVTIAALALDARPADWEQGNPAAKVADRPRIVLLVSARTCLDAGNLFKCVADALGDGVLYTDDNQIAYCAALVEARTRKDPGGRIAVAVLAPGTSNTAVLAAAAELTTQVLL